MIGLILLYVVGFIYSFGVLYKFWNTNWPLIARSNRKWDVIFSLFLAILWPIALILLFLFSKHEDTWIPLYPWQPEKELEVLRERYSKKYSDFPYMPATYDEYLKRETQ